MEGVIGDTWAWGSRCTRLPRHGMAATPCCRHCWGRPWTGRSVPATPQESSGGRGEGGKLRTGSGVGCSFKGPRGLVPLGDVGGSVGSCQPRLEGAGGWGLCSEPSLEGDPSPGPRALTAWHAPPPWARVTEMGLLRLLGHLCSELHADPSPLPRPPTSRSPPLFVARVSRRMTLRPESLGMRPFWCVCLMNSVSKTDSPSVFKV